MKFGEDLPRMTPMGKGGPPIALRVFGFVALAIVVLSVLTTKPYPGVSGDGLWVSVSLVLLVGGIAMSIGRSDLPRFQRLGGLVLVSFGACILTAVQPDSAGYAAIYFVAAIAGMRVAPPASLIVAGGGLLAQCLIVAFANEHPQTTVPGLIFSVVPWYLITRLIRRLAMRTADAEQLVAELQESRAAHAEAAALNERGRLARDMHDVLAHSLSALALQLEGTRLLARDRDADPEVIAGLERAHRLAAGGLAEARQAIAALRGDALPGPERLRDLAEAFGPNAHLTIVGEPRETSSEARLALYRTAQEALTNIRKHSAADRVEIRLEYAGDGTRLSVQDFGPGAPVMVGGSGYGLTGMKERAELLGGTLDAGPTADGFKVELWLPLKVLLADDQRLVREGLGTLLNLLDGIELVGTAADGQEAIELAERLDPDIVLMDLRMPRVDGIEAIRQLSARGPRPACIALTTFADDASVLGALRAGARGYLTKDAGAEEIRAAIEAVSRGEAALDPVVQRHVVAALSCPPEPDATASAKALPDDLTPREAEVLGLIAEGLTNAEIAERLVVSAATVKSHVNHIFAKIGARDRAQAVVYAYANGLTESSSTA